MKTGNITKLMLLAVITFGCADNKKQDSDAAQGTPVDSTVIGKDSSQADVRRDIELSDPAKQTLPGRDTTNTDEPK
ncbi:hypothetical protein [Dyadobacter sandarakinus]|uniref:Lipoprotein n=1 Tax=Dyadobacter sandarakinus TaxID=2747268 RepID=A0ABX7I5I8_9BACT|nr:hypothetical protein [Dyadobacter sandarakinus]QRR00276.1 hypothetical protein HWI92_04835 [Dyadobacter sandarakinus]